MSREQNDHVINARRKTRNISLSALLRQAIHDEAERQQKAAGVKPLQMQTQESEDSDPYTFRVTLYALPLHIEEGGVKFKSAVSPAGFNIISSLGGHSSLLVSPHISYINSPLVLLRNDNRLRRLLPELEPGWTMATFDEHERLWACDEYGKHIAVVHLGEQRGHGFVLPGSSYPVAAIAAYNNNLALAMGRKFIAYRYNGKSLEETFQWEGENRINGIKPDTKEGGWWFMTRVHLSKLGYFSPNRNTARPEMVTEVAWVVKLLGDWPEKVYFVYADYWNLELYYTLDPREGWRKVPLWYILQQETEYVEPLSMSRAGDSLFAVLCTDEHYLLVRLQAGKAELISAFDSHVWSARWGNWLVLYSHNPLTFAQAYEKQAKITELPENEGMLFFDLHTSQFYTKQYAPYSVPSALRNMPKSGTNRSSKIAPAR
ncbi:MAG: hypothetical protein QW094_07915 [Candidatus Caldarchaeum sp.]